jgi:hypothetical protein
MKTSGQTSIGSTRGRREVSDTGAVAWIVRPVCDACRVTLLPNR